MKKAVMFLMLICYAFIGLAAGPSPPAQLNDKVYFTTNKAEAGESIYVTDNQALADQIVCLTENRALADIGESYWLVTDNKALADRVIYISDVYCVDCTIVYFTENTGIRSDKENLEILPSDKNVDVYDNRTFY